MKRLILLIAVGSIAFGLVYGSAASLNAPATGSLGAGVSAVSACSNVSKVVYTTSYNATAKYFEVTGVTLDLTGNACVTKVADIVLAFSDGTILGTGQVTIASDPSNQVVVPIVGVGAVPVDAAAVYNTAIVIQ